MKLSAKVDLTYKIVAIIAAVLAAGKIVYEVQESRMQHARELRWKQANSAQELINGMVSDKLANDALTMLDWNGRVYETSEGEKVQIVMGEVIDALRTNNLAFSPKEIYIRDCIDAFLFRVEGMEQAIDNGLIEFRDVRFPMEYYARALEEYGIMPSLNQFIKEYRYKNAEQFFKRFDQ